MIVFGGMTAWSYLTVLPIIFSLVAIAEMIVLYRMTKRPGFLILMCPMIYIFVFYIFFLWNTHCCKFDNSQLQVWFRLMIVVIVISLVVYFSTEIYAIKKAKQRMEEKYGESDK